MNREDLATALERHATDAANAAALALRAGAAFKVWEKLQSDQQYLDIYAWRAGCMAQDGVSTCKDFEQAQSPWDESIPMTAPTWSS
ncbi:hypothetical protein ACWGNM_39315 [Streptomyces sp. NPDC055796]